MKKAPALTIRKAKAVLVVWWDAHVNPRRCKTEVLDGAANERSIAFSLGWLIKETAKKLIIYPNAWTWDSEQYRIDSVDERLTIPKKWVLALHELRVPARMFKYE